MNPAWVNVIIIIATSIISAAAAAGGAIMGVKIEMKHMWKAIEKNAGDIEKVEQRRHDGEGVLHDRVTRMNERITAAGVNGPPRPSA